jgi:hypothetical protein
LFIAILKFLLHCHRFIFATLHVKRHASPSCPKPQALIKCPPPTPGQVHLTR